MCGNSDGGDNIEIKGDGDSTAKHYWLCDIITVGVLMGW